MYVFILYFEIDGEKTSLLINQRLSTLESKKDKDTKYVIG